MFITKRTAALIAVTGLSFMPLQADQMKCGAGKCGASMQQGKACPCNIENCDHENCAHMKDPSKPCDCNASKQTKIKCGSAQPTPKMKCGAGKCGSN